LEREVFRFVHVSDRDDPCLVDDFRSDAERHKKPRGRSAVIPGHMDGMSSFRSLTLARDRWQTIAAYALKKGQTVAIGEHIARVGLVAGQGFAYEDLGGPDGHITIWGAPDRLVAAVGGIEPAAI
jgi:hypothetical protein